jgi:predicted AlkP superfamily phosphohydrolase/phosphomutase
MTDHVSQRIVVIGLDGATLDLIQPWAKAGHLPNLARLMSEGSYGELASTIPPMSPSAWTSFMTGKNPGKHGILDFTQRLPNSYRTHITTRTREATLWGMLNQRGLRVCVTNVPQTYPPEKVNGIMVTGLGTPAHNPFTYPAGLGAELEANGYNINSKVSYRPGNEMAFLESAISTEERNVELTIQLLQRVKWDLFVTVLRFTDQVPHFFWRYMDNEHPDHVPSTPELRDAILNIYRKADELVGKLVHAAGDALVIIMSDHGFGPLYKDVFLNEWLHQGGFVALRQNSAVGSGLRKLMQRIGFTRGQVGPALSRMRLGWLRAWLRNSLGERASLIPNVPRPHISDVVDWQRTQAYSMGYIGQVYLNVRGRDPEGIVPPEDYETVRDQVADHLMRLVDPKDNKPVIDRIIRREQVCHGPYADTAPDLFVLMRDLTYITRESYDWPQDGQIFTRPLTGENGGHRIPGVLIMHGDAVRKGQIIHSASIMDIAPTILYLSGCPIPSDLDGAVLKDWLTTQAQVGRPIVLGAPVAPSDTQFELSSSDEDELIARLRDLGYVE